VNATVNPDADVAARHFEDVRFLFVVRHFFTRLPCVLLLDSQGLSRWLLMVDFGLALNSGR
jgi:hypothetical protein